MIQRLLQSSLSAVGTRDKSALSSRTTTAAGQHTSIISFASVQRRQQMQGREKPNQSVQYLHMMKNEKADENKTTKSNWEMPYT